MTDWKDIAGDEISEERQCARALAGIRPVARGTERSVGSRNIYPNELPLWSFFVMFFEAHISHFHAPTSFSLARVLSPLVTLEEKLNLTFNTKEATRSRHPHLSPLRSAPPHHPQDGKYLFFVLAVVTVTIL